MNDLISIIVPVYNVEKYLKKCVESIINQSYSNIEIILVDDGSPDHCPEICDELSYMDNRIKVIHKSNGGLSDARNAGLKIANGKYIGFVDSDDYIHPDMYLKLYNGVKSTNSKVGICSIQLVNESGIPISTDWESPIHDGVIANSESLNMLENGDNGKWYYVTAWNKLYEASVFKDIKFPTERIHEDEFIVHHVFLQCENIFCVSTPLYYYVQRKNSIMSDRGIRRLDKAYALYDRYITLKNSYPLLARRNLRNAAFFYIAQMDTTPYSKWPSVYKKDLRRTIAALLSSFDMTFFKFVVSFIIKYR